MRSVVIILFVLVGIACGSGEKLRARIDALGRSGTGDKYETGLACMQYILLGGSDVTFSKTLVRKLIDLEFYAEAVSAVESLLKRLPDDAELFHLRGIAYRGQHQYALALADGKSATEAQPSNTSFLSELGITRTSLEIWDQITLLNAELMSTADSSAVLLQRAEKFFDLKEFDAALFDLGALSKRGPASDSIYFTEQAKSIYKDAQPVKKLEALLEYFRKRISKEGPPAR